MNDLKIVKAIYYDPDIGLNQGTDVTDELSSLIVDGKLFYNGLYNFIFTDNFKGKLKRLRIEVEYKRKKFIKFYNENDRLNLPADLGKIENPFLKNLLIFLSFCVVIFVVIILTKNANFKDPWIAWLIGILGAIIADIVVNVITKIFL